MSFSVPACTQKQYIFLEKAHFWWQAGEGKYHNKGYLLYKVSRKQKQVIFATVPLRVFLSFNTLLFLQLRLYLPRGCYGPSGVSTGCAGALGHRNDRYIHSHSALSFAWAAGRIDSDSSARSLAESSEVLCQSAPRFRLAK